MISTFWRVLIVRPQRAIKFLVRLFDAIWVYDEHGHTVYASYKLLNLVQTNVKEVSFFDYFLSRSIQLSTLKSYWQRALQGETVWFLPKVRGTYKNIECSLRFDADLKLMFLRAKKSSRNAYIQKLIEDYERLISVLFSHPNLAAALIEMDGMVVRCNQAFHQLLGTNEKESIHIDDFIEVADEFIDANLKQKLLNQEIESYTLEKQLISRNREILWVNISISIIDAPVHINKSIKYFVILLEDITENRKIYNALVRTEGKWKTFVSNSFSLFIQTSSTGQIIYVSPAVERILGYKGEELLDLYITDFIHPNDLVEFEAALYYWTQATQLTESSIECRWKAKSGLWVCLSMQGRRFPLSLEIDGLIIDGFDITDRKFLEAELRVNEDKFNSLIFNMPGAVFQCNSTYIIEFISDRIQDITGYPAFEFINNQVRPYISIIHPEDIKLVKLSMADSLLEQNFRSVEYRIIHADGRIRWVSEYRQGMFNKHGKLLRFIGILLDISDRKHAQAQLHRSEATNRVMMRLISNLLSSGAFLSRS